MDTTMGAWFEAIVLKVLKDENGMFYHIRFEE